MGENTGDADLDERAIHDVLRNDRRRLALEALRESGGCVSVSDLAEAVAARETGIDPAPTNKRQSAYVSLHQTHLPKLDSLGIVEYNSDARDVQLLDRAEEIEVYMEVVPEYGLSWGEFYFGWGLLGLLLVGGLRVDVPILAELDGWIVALGFSLGLMIASAYHVYKHQERVLFQRLLDERS